MLTYIVAIMSVWLLAVSVVLYLTRAHYNNLVAKTRKRTIGDILDVLIKKDEMFSSRIDEMGKHIAVLTEQEKTHYQKIGFLRFNPFERIGGEQSFIIALLNSEDTGIIMNFLYTREGIRVYAKKVRKGLSEEYELSNEEKEAIKKAR